MDEFNQNFGIENNEDNNFETENSQQDFENTEQIVESIDVGEDVVEESSDDFLNQDEPVWNKVEYTPVNSIKDYNPMSRGLRIFCAVMAAVVLLTATTAAGYFLGRGSVANNYIGASVDVDLSAKPKNEDTNTPAQIYENVNKSIVGIRVYNEAGQASDASGVVYTRDGYIITNDHIYSEIGAPKFKVFMYDGTECDATYVAGDTVSDLAVLKVDGKKLQVAEFGNSNELVNGESVVAMGRPNDSTDFTSITSGIVSLTKRRVKTTSSYSASLIQTDSAINPGSSGGALVNMYGQIVGITSSKLAGVEYDSVGFAIPTTTMKRVVEQLIAEGKVTDRAKLGISYNEIDSVTAEVKDFAAVGLLVVSVSEDSDIYGKVGEGDFITHINGIAITNDDIILNIIEECKAGDKVSLTVLLKDGSEVDFDVKLRANTSDSSYSDTIKSEREEQSQGSTDGTFDFPFGE